MRVISTAILFSILALSAVSTPEDSDSPFSKEELSDDGSIASSPLIKGDQEGCSPFMGDIYSAPREDPPVTKHIIKKGETLWKLSKLYYGTFRFAHFLAEYNAIKDARRILVGREIRIPHEMSYEVKQGDNLTKISKKLLGDQSKYRYIAKYNNIPDPNLIQVGMILKLSLIPSIEVETAPKEVQKPVEAKEQGEVTLPIEEEIPKAKEKEVEEPGKTEEEIPAEEEAETSVETVLPPEEAEEIPEAPSLQALPAVPPEEKTEQAERQPLLEQAGPGRGEEVSIPSTPEKEKFKPEEKLEEPLPQVPEVRKQLGPWPEPTWPPISPWVEEKPTEKEESTEPERLPSLLEAVSRWGRATAELDLKKFRAEKEIEERGVKLPMQSLLQIDGYKSVTIEYNKTHYFGKSDINQYRGYYSGGWDSSYYGDYDYGYGMEYGSSYSSYGGYSDYGGYYGGGYSYGGYGMDRRSTGVNIDQELDVHLHGRIGTKTHVDVDYNDTGRSQFGGMGQKEQKIAVWYEGSKDEIIQKAAFGDIRLDFPSSRFINVSRNLFGAELIAALKGLKLTAFGTRTKGIKETWKSRGQSRQAGGGIGTRIMDINYIKERYYAINVGEDGMIHDSYLPIVSGSEQIYIDDGIGTNNDSGISTAQGYFDYQYPGEDYNIDYTTGQIEFLKNISAGYKIVVAYKYRGDGGGVVGNPDAMFVDDDSDGIIDEKDDPSDPIGYVTIKEAGQRGAELRNVYSLGNRNINRRNFNLSIWREGGTESFQTDEGPVLYTRIFGLDSDGDGLVDPELIDFEKGTLTFRSPRPFVIDDPNSPYYKYRDQLNNEAIYSENPKYTDQKYVIQADYSYQMPQLYLGRLNILPESEEVRVNGRKLKRGVDYIMIYEVGSVEIFRELNEYDEITIDYEYMPFGGQFQQTIAGIWAEYSLAPRERKAGERSPRSPYGESMSPFSQGSDTYPRYDSSGYDTGRFDYSGGGYDYGGTGYGSSFDYGYDSYSYYGGRRGRYGGSSTTRSRRSQRTGYGRGSEGLNINLGYIYNTGGRSTDIPDVNSAPNRLQALVMNGNWGHEFNVARIFGLVPFVSLKGAVPLSIYLDVESAYSRNNPNSVGYAMIDSMEGAKESSRIPTYKFSWQIGSVPVMETQVGTTIPPSIDNRAIFHIARKDKEASYGNYMKNREVPATEINPLSRSIERNLVMEIGYELDEDASWGSLSYSIAPAGSDFSDYEFLEVWLKVEGDKNVNFNIDFGIVSEDTDGDSRLDSEDLPNDLTDTNGDGKIDILDLSKENLPDKDKYKGNGRLDTGEDTGWTYNSGSGAEIATIGKDNTVLDKEDLDGDLVLDESSSYYEFTIPLNNLPPEWIRRENKNTGWIFLSIPLESAKPAGRSPTWGVVKHARIWLEKNAPGTVIGKLQWYSIVVAGNSWEKGLIVDESGKLSKASNESILIGTKNNYEFEDYLKEYRTIENNKDFKDLHPYVESAFDLGEEDRKEQTLTINYSLLPGSTGYTMRELSGLRRGDGQDFSKHQNIRLWLHGDGSGATLIMRLGSNVDDFGAGSPVTKSKTETGTGYYSSYSYYSYSRLGGQGYYEYSRVIDWTGWKLITIPLADNNGDGHPDSLKAVNEPSITNIGQILVGLKNNTQSPVSGEVWVNEIHLNEPHVKSGWARRFDLSLSLVNIFSLRAGYARQDKDFENSAGQTGRTSQMSMGYSTSNYDYNVNTELRLISWFPIGFDISHRESESIRQFGMISSYESGKTKTDNRTFSVSLDKERFPSLSFSYDNQKTWNERRGMEISDLYSSDFRYSLGSILSINTNYSHERLSIEKSGSDKTSRSSSYYYYGSDRDSIIDSGSLSLQISPSKSFSINPSYDVRRELERESDAVSSSADGTSTGEKNGRFVISGRDQRFSLRPTLRQFFGIRPSLSGRYGFSENWFRGEKDATVNTNLNFGINFALKNWLRSDKKKDSKNRKGTAESEGPQADQKDSPPKSGSPGGNLPPNPSLQGGAGDSNASPSSPASAPGGMEENESREDSNEGEDGEPLELPPQDEFPRGAPFEIEERIQEERGNWIEREKDELKRKMGERERKKEKGGGGILARSLESFSINTDLGLDINDYLRQLPPGMGLMEIINLDPESKYRTRSTRNRRLSIRSNIEPFSWSTFGTNMSFTNRFTKSMGTASNSNSTTVGGDMKLFNSSNSLSLMLKYDMTTQVSGNRSGRISSSISHNPSVTLRNKWSSGVGSSFGIRTTFRDQERSGVKTKSLIIAPNFNVDYDLHVEGKMGLPLTSRSIKLDHNLDVSNTFSAMVRREKLGVNRDEKSEQYGTSLDVSYNLKEKVRATLRLSVDYNHDRVRESADYVSISGAMMVRGEFR